MYEWDGHYSLGIEQKLSCCQVVFVKLVWYILYTHNVQLTLYCPMTPYSVMVFHKPIIIYMEGLILGGNTLYRLFCFFKLFLKVGKGLSVTELILYALVARQPILSVCRSNDTWWIYRCRYNMVYRHILHELWRTYPPRSSCTLTLEHALYIKLPCYAYVLTLLFILCMSSSAQNNCLVDEHAARSLCRDPVEALPPLLEIAARAVLRHQVTWTSGDIPRHLEGD